jgi:hypothetical protein
VYELDDGRPHRKPSATRDRSPIDGTKWGHRVAEKISLSASRPTFPVRLRSELDPSPGVLAIERLELTHQAIDLLILSVR